MDIEKAIFDRRSIRDFLPKKVSRELIEQIIASAECAPSDENSQPWHFTVIQEDRLKEKIGDISVFAGEKYFTPKRDELLKKFHGMSDKRCAEMVERFTSGSLFAFLKTAPVIIIVSTENNFFSHCSTGAAIQNLMLSAMAHELSTCWTVIGLTDDESLKAIKQIAGIAEERSIVSVLALGYPAQTPKPRGRKPVDEVITWL